MALDINQQKTKALTVVSLGDETCKVEARGRFDDQAAKDYVPNFDSDKLLIDVPTFEGPLDLLLHLIRRHSMDIFDIPIVLITKKYLEALEQMQSLDINLAGDFLVMAATLAQIKSKMLLPPEEQEVEEEEEDPRADLVRRLLEYQRFKEVADALKAMRSRGLDTFKRNYENDWLAPEERDQIPEEPTKVQPVEIYDLVGMFAKALEKYKPKTMHSVQFEPVSVRARITEMIEFAKFKQRFSFEEALNQFQVKNGRDVIVTLLSILEMAKLRLLTVEQSLHSPEIWLCGVEENLSTAGDDLLGDLSADEENLTEE